VFKVVFPATLLPAQVQAAGISLASQKSNENESMDGAEVVKLTKYAENQRNVHATGG
jgi:hypothetical protein